LEANPDKIDWDMLSTNPNAIHLLEANPDKINMCWLSENPNAIHLISKMLDEIDVISHVNFPVCVSRLLRNPNAIQLLEHILESNKYKHKIVWYGLSLNPNAMHLLEANQDKINWYDISTNPAIFKSYHEGINEYVLK
jgi:hypothetical protein